NVIQANTLYPAAQAGLNNPFWNAPQPFFGNQVVGQVLKRESAQVNLNFQWGPTINQVYLFQTQQHLPLPHLRREPLPFPATGFSKAQRESGFPSISGSPSVHQEESHPFASLPAACCTTLLPLCEP